MVTNQIQKAILALLAGVFLIVTGCGGGGEGGQGSLSAGAGDDPGGSTSGVTVTNTYSQAKDLGVGDVLYVDLSQNRSLDFNGVSASSEFSLVLANTSPSAGILTVQLNGDLSDAGMEISKSLGDEESEEMAEELPVDEASLSDVTPSFHDSLRFMESNLDETETPVDIYEASAGKSASANISASVSVGDSRSFKVLSGLGGNSNFVTVQATAECVGSAVAFYIDDRVSVDMLSNSDIQKLCDDFDRDAAREYNLFGGVSDVNGDGVVVVLMTPQINRLGAQNGGIITGFFTANDLYAESGSNQASNHMEILYIMVPDPSGQFGTTISNSFGMKNLLPPVLVHELQHAISYNQHVFVRGGTSEESWLNEGMSHLAEDLLGHNQENPSRYAIYLRSPQTYPLVTASSPGLASRGAAYLFLRYLYEQSASGDQFVKNLVQTSNKGIFNVEKSFGGSQVDFDQFGEFFLRWSIALAMTDKGVSQDRRFTYQVRSKNSETGAWSGVCIVCAADDGRQTRLSGVAFRPYNNYQHVSTSPTSALYYQFSGAKNEMKFQKFGNTGEGFGVLIRTK